MSSFFFTQLSDNGRGYRYQGVKRFLKKAKVTMQFVLVVVEVVVVVVVLCRYASGGCGGGVV